ncbi:MAG TPA: TatD family hydrolase [Acidimicrobiales bacterium]|nr:TatD family hydrolase [Acidimicrobiales bacterium]
MTDGLRWADSHCHVPWKDTDPAVVIPAARAAGVERLITIGTDAETTAAAIEVARAYDDVWATVGLHPHDATQGVDTVAGFLDGSPEIVAVGECGLDYHYNHSPADVQRAAFAAQIALAKENDLALVVHTREAWDDTLDVLTAEGVPERTVIHCFTGGAAEARRCLDIGAYLSFSGIVTFKAADDVREAAAICPLDRLLVETDAPYLAPVPHRGKPNEPAWVAFVGAAVAGVKGLEPRAVAGATWENLEAVFLRASGGSA